MKDIRKLGGSLDEWVPPDYDVYCVGVQVSSLQTPISSSIGPPSPSSLIHFSPNTTPQECAILQDLRTALHAHLGGPEHYTMFTAEIGAANLLFGTIALTVFARTREVESGAFARIDALAGSLRNGVNLVVTKTANKVRGPMDGVSMCSVSVYMCVLRTARSFDHIHGPTHDRAWWGWPSATTTLLLG